jgi:prepilin-type N-terminal cleavage/methylation domain-containing protein
MPTVNSFATPSNRAMSRGFSMIEMLVGVLIISF